MTARRSLVQELATCDGKGVTRLRALYSAHADRATFADELLAALAVVEAQAAVTWLLKRHLERGGALTEEQVLALVRALSALEPWSAQLHVLQCLPYLELPGRARRPIERFVRRALESDVKFVQAWAYSGLHALARRFESLRPEVRRLFHEGHTHGPASVRARIRNLREQGF